MLQRQERHWVTDMCAIQEATIIIIILISHYCYYYIENITTSYVWSFVCLYNELNLPFLGGGNYESQPWHLCPYTRHLTIASSFGLDVKPLVLCFVWGSQKNPLLKKRRGFTLVFLAGLAAYCTTAHCKPIHGASVKCCPTYLAGNTVWLSTLSRPSGV